MVLFKQHNTPIAEKSRVEFKEFLNYAVGSWKKFLYNIQELCPFDRPLDYPLMEVSERMSSLKARIPYTEGSVSGAVGCC